MSAERFTKIPDGLQITISSDYRTCTAIVVLHPLPEWRARILEPIPVPRVMRNPIDVAQALHIRDDFDMHAVEKKRALGLVQALAIEAHRRDYAVSAVPAPAKDRWGMCSAPRKNRTHQDDPRPG